MLHIGEHLLSTGPSLISFPLSTQERAQLVLPWVVMGIIDIVLSIVGMAVLGIAAVRDFY